MNIVTIILFGDSKRGEVRADLSIVPLADEANEEVDEVDDELDDDELDDDDDDDDDEVGELAEVAATGDVVEAVEMADESDELLSDKLDEPSARLPLLHLPPSFWLLLPCSWSSCLICVRLPLVAAGGVLLLVVAAPIGLDSGDDDGLCGWWW